MTYTDDFYIKSGELSHYAYACGYISSVWIGQIHLTLWLEHNAYHVRAHDHIKQERVFWDVFDSLSPARKRYIKAKHDLSHKPWTLINNFSHTVLKFTSEKKLRDHAKSSRLEIKRGGLCAADRTFYTIGSLYVPAQEVQNES